MRVVWVKEVFTNVFTFLCESSRCAYTDPHLHAEVPMACNNFFLLIAIG